MVEWIFFWIVEILVILVVVVFVFFEENVMDCEGIGFCWLDVWVWVREGGCLVCMGCCVMKLCFIFFFVVVGFFGWNLFMGMVIFCFM